MRCWNQVVFWSPTRELASGFPTPLEMRVFFLFGILMRLTSSAIFQLMCVLHPLGKNLRPLRKDLHWVNSSINRQSNSSINSKFIGIWSFTIIPIMFYLELLKPWMQDVHNIVLQSLEGVCNRMWALNFCIQRPLQVFRLVTRKKRVVTGSGWPETLHQGH